MPCLRFLEMRLIGQRGPICARARTGQPVVGDTAGCNFPETGIRHPARAPLGPLQVAIMNFNASASMSGFSSKKISSPPRSRAPCVLANTTSPSGMSNSRPAYFARLANASAALTVTAGAASRTGAGPWTRFCAWAWAKPAQATDASESEKIKCLMRLIMRGEPSSPSRRDRCTERLHSYCTAVF